MDWIETLRARVIDGSIDLVFAAFIFIAFWIASKIVYRSILALSARSDADREDILNLLAQVARIALLIAGILTALSSMRVNIAALIAGLGLTGFALGFAFRDILSNFLAGVIILFFRPFKRGDRVTITTFTGTVMQIDLRYTTILVDSGHVLIPNATLINNPVLVLNRTEIP